jgi:hypothetical protein
MSAWTEAEKDFLTAECERGVLTYQQIGKALGRNKATVASVARELGLRKRILPRFWTPERCEELARLWPTMTKADLAKHFKTTSGSIESKGGQMGLTKRRANRGMILAPEQRAQECCGACGIRHEFAAGCQRDGCQHYAPPVYQPLVRYGVVGELA